MEIFGAGGTLIIQNQLNKAWSKADGSITSRGDRSLLLKKSHCI